MLGWIYIILFAVQVFWLIRACRRHGRIWLAAVGNLITALLAAFGVWYFDNLPGYGFMPGLAFFPEFFYSLCAAAAFMLLSVISFLCWLFTKRT